MKLEPLAILLTAALLLLSLAWSRQERRDRERRDQAEARHLRRSRDEQQRRMRNG